MHLRRLGGLDAVGHHGEREIAVGEDAHRAPSVDDDHRSDAAVAHQRTDAGQRLRDLGGDDRMGHDLVHPHGSTIPARRRAGEEGTL